MMGINRLLGCTLARGLLPILGVGRASLRKISIPFMRSANFQMAVIITSTIWIRWSGSRCKGGG